MLDSGAKSREQLTTAKTGLEQELKEIEKQLKAYSDTDPTEIERKKEETKKFADEVAIYTDEIFSLEGHVKTTMGLEAVKELQTSLYADEFDEEEGGLRVV